MPARHAAAICSVDRTAHVSSAPMSSKRARLRSWLAPAIAAVLLCAAFWVLHGELQAIRYRDLQAALARLGAEHLLLALLCYDPFGEVAVYPPAGKATSIALFISGDGGLESRGGRHGAPSDRYARHRGGHRHPSLSVRRRQRARTVPQLGLRFRGPGARGPAPSRARRLPHADPGRLFIGRGAMRRPGSPSRAISTRSAMPARPGNSSPAPAMPASSGYRTSATASRSSATGYRNFGPPMPGWPHRPSRRPARVRRWATCR